MDYHGHGSKISPKCSFFLFMASRAGANLYFLKQVGLRKQALLPYHRVSADFCGILLFSQTVIAGNGTLILSKHKSDGTYFMNY